MWSTSRFLTGFFSGRDCVWAFSVIMLTFAAAYPAQESSSALIKVDDQGYFQCPASGCWYKMRYGMGWDELARRIGADQEKLRQDNPQVSEPHLQAGQLIRLRERSQAAQ